MAFISLLGLIIILGLVIGIIIFFGFRNGASGLKLMLLGINVTLTGGIIAVDPGASLGGIEYLIILLGVIISIIGLLKKD